MDGPWTSSRRDERVDYLWSGEEAKAHSRSPVTPPDHRYPSLSHRPPTLRRSDVAAGVEADETAAELNNSGMPTDIPETETSYKGRERLGGNVPGNEIG